MFATFMPRSIAAVFVLVCVGLYLAPSAAEDTQAKEKKRKKIDAALEREISFAFTETPFRDVLKFISDFYKITFTIDEDALKKAGIAGDQPITANAQKAKLKNALKDILKPLKLAYKVTDNGITITSETEKNDSDEKSNDENKDENKDEFAQVDQQPFAALRVIAYRLQEPPGKAPKKTTASVKSEPAEKSPAPIKRQIAPKKPDFVARPQTRRRDPIEALQREVSFDFHQTPLQDVVQFLRDFTEANIVIDAAGLEKAKIKATHPVSTTLTDVTLETAFDLILRQSGLGVAVAREVLLITDAETVSNYLETEVYRVADLIVVQESDQRVRMLGQEFVKMIATTIEPNTWKQNGGQGALALHEPSLSLVVTNQRLVHAKIVLLFDELRQAKKEWHQSSTVALESAIAAEALEVRERATKELERENAVRISQASQHNYTQQKMAQEAEQRAREEANKATQEADKWRKALEVQRAEALSSRNRLQAMEKELSQLREEKLTAVKQAEDELANARREAEAQNRRIREEQEKNLVRELELQRSIAAQARAAAEKARKEAEELVRRVRTNVLPTKSETPKPPTPK